MISAGTQSANGRTVAEHPATVTHAYNAGSRKGMRAQRRGLHVEFDAGKQMLTNANRPLDDDDELYIYMHLSVF